MSEQLADFLKAFNNIWFAVSQATFESYVPPRHQIFA